MPPTLTKNGKRWGRPPKPKKRKVRPCDLVTYNEATETFVYPQEIAQEHITLWDKRREIKVAGCAAPLVKDLRTYLEKKKHLEIYRDQKPRAGRKHFITMWDPIKKRKISGRSAPCKGSLDYFMQKYPHLEVYDKQDACLKPSQLASRCDLHNTVTDTVVSGNARPLRENIESYLKRHPEYRKLNCKKRTKLGDFVNEGESQALNSENSSFTIMAETKAENKGDIDFSELGSLELVSNPSTADKNSAFSSAFAEMVDQCMATEKQEFPMHCDLAFGSDSFRQPIHESEPIRNIEENCNFAKSWAHAIHGECKRQIDFSDGIDLFLLHDRKSEKLSNWQAENSAIHREDSYPKSTELNSLLHDCTAVNGENGMEAPYIRNTGEPDASQFGDIFLDSSWDQHLITEEASKCPTSSGKLLHEDIFEPLLQPEA